MRPIVTDQVVWSVGRSVCWSVTVVSHAKTAEQIEMQFGLWERIGPRNHMLDGGPDPRMGRDDFEGEGRPIVKYVYGCSAVSCAKMAESIEMPFGIWTRVGPRKHVGLLGGECTLAPAGEYH